MLKVKSLLILFLLVAGSLWGQTDVGGLVSGTWDVAGSPYIVISDVEIAVETSLIIEAGVEVQFDSQKKMVIYGELRVNGVEGDSVLFTSSSATPQTGDWYGIRFEPGSSAQSYMRYAIVEYGDSESHSNRTYAGIVNCNQASPEISNCLLRFNNHNDIHVYNASVEVSYTTIVRDGENGGNLVFYDGAVGVSDHNRFIGNGSGQAIYADRNATVYGYNNTIYDYQRGVSIAGLYGSQPAEYQGTNDIIWLVDEPAYIETGSSGSFTYSCLDGGFAGTGNIDVDPLFTDPATQDFTLQASSPCIDAGDPDTDGDGVAWNLDLDDQDPDGTRLDIGAYYYDQTTSSLSLVMDSVFVGELVSIPVLLELDEITDVLAVEFDIDSYANGLEFTGIDTVGTLLSGLNWMWAVNPAGDMLQVAFAGSDTLLTGGVFCYLEFQVFGEICTTAPLAFAYASINGILVEQTTDGSVYIEPIPDWGDVDEDGDIDSMDAADILIDAVGLDTLLCQGLANADVYMDGEVDDMDASIILQWVVGLVDSLPVYDDDERFLASGSLSVPAEGTAWAGEIAEYPVTLENGRRLSSFKSEIHYDPSRLAVATDSIGPVMAGENLSGFSIQTSNDPEMGVLRIVGASGNMAGVDGTFLTLRFRAADDFQTGEETELTFTDFEFNSNHAVEVFTQTVVSVDEFTTMPTRYELAQNYPNPFNPSTTIRYSLPAATDVRLTIYDLSGREVAILVNAREPAGYHTVKWTGMAAAGNPVSTGVYLARLDAGDYSQVIKMVYLR